MTSPNTAARRAGAQALDAVGEISEAKRWTIVGLLSASITINLLDRQTLAVLAPFLRDPTRPAARTGSGPTRSTRSSPWPSTSG